MPTSGSGTSTGESGGSGYAAWPDTDDLDARLVAAGVVLREDVTDEQKQAKLDAVVATVLRETRREFVTSTETRYFDGSGTPEMDIDEFTEIDTVNTVWGESSMELPTVTALPEDGLPNTRIVLFRGGIPGVFLGWPLDRFPTGRGNIAVTATWGYGATIPADLWEAVAVEAAAQLADEAGFAGTSTSGGSAAGALVAWREGNSSATYQGTVGNDSRSSSQVGWHGAFMAAVRRYSRGGTRQARKLRPVMI